MATDPIVILSTARTPMGSMQGCLADATATELGATAVRAAVERLPNTSNVTFRGGDGEGIVIGLDLSGVAVSTGSACSSGRVEPSPVLLAMGLTPEEALAGMTINAARALGIAHEAGSIAASKAADLCVWRIESLAELGYWVGLPGPERRIYGGVEN